MDKSRPVAERVRPILNAMERSIDAARRRRLHLDDEPEQAVARPAPTPPETPAPCDDDVPRLKARPKRPSSFPPFDGGYRSQAG